MEAVMERTQNNFDSARLVFLFIATFFDGLAQNICRDLLPALRFMQKSRAYTHSPLDFSASRILVSADLF